MNTNEKLQVLNEDHEVIKNLYATGNNVSGISYGTYQDVEGVGLGFSLTSGRLAGIQAARNDADSYRTWHEWKFRKSLIL